MSVVLVAIDETDASQRVAGFVNDFFHRPDVEVIGLNVARGTVPWLPPMVGWGGAWVWSAYPYPYTPVEPGRASGEEAETVEEIGARAVEESGLEAAETVVDDGMDPADAILSVADERGADLIVIGTGHKGLLERMLVPSVSQKVLRHADRPVLVVP